MKIVQWVDPYTNESLTETEKKLFSKNSEYPIIDGIPKFVKENPSEPQYDIEKCFSYQWTKSEFGQPEKFSSNDIKNDVIETMDLTDEDLSLFENKIVAFSKYSSQVRPGGRDADSIRSQAKYRGQEVGKNLCEAFFVHRFIL